jgi:hypothetical protein
MKIESTTMGEYSSGMSKILSQVTRGRIYEERQGKI